VRKPSLDVLLLFILVIARVRIDTHADMVLPDRHADVARLVGGWWPAWSLQLLQDWLSDPVTLLLASLTFALLALYVILEAISHRGEDGRQDSNGQTFYRARLALIYAIILTAVFGKTALLIGLRHITNPAAYTHDGGVIQTEVTIRYLLSGVNPYVADYVNTPMADWGTSYRTALYHYPYLPWTFLFSAPFYLLSNALLGWYDQRTVYLLLFAITLLLAPRLARNCTDRLCLTMILGLNPLLGLDVIFGQNDSFVLFWIVLAVWLLEIGDWRLEVGEREHPAGSLARGVATTTLLASAAFGLACASKPTAWFLVPFFALYLLRDRGISLEKRRPLVLTLIRQTWPAMIVFILIAGPWFVWNPDAMIDDVWRWSAGTATAPYQITGWGLANFVLAFGLVPNRLAYFPFWVLELLVGLPLLFLLLWQQARKNSISAMLFGYGALLFTFLYVSRFLNENYLGYLLAFFALAYFADDPAGAA
jgi:hypothetical protein